MIVVIPCWRRPAHLAALLRTIERARLADEQHYVFSVDHGAAREIDAVIDSLALKRRVFDIVHLRAHGFAGPAYNILQGWRLGEDAAYALDLHGPIGLLEEDLLVAEDIFEFWTDALELAPHAVGVSACANQNRPPAQRPRNPSSGDAATQIYTDVSYQSLAVALRPKLISTVLQHATAAYFADPMGYVKRELPDEGLPDSACSQDGLFHRVIRRHQLELLYPIVPRACHVGWYGYNRRHGMPLDPRAWRTDADQILTMPADQMNARADPRFRDIARCHLIRPRVDFGLI